MTKQEMIEVFRKTPIEIGETVSFKIDNSSKSGEIISIDLNTKTFCTKGNTSNRGYDNIPLSDITKRYKENIIGANPIVEKNKDIRSIAFNLDSILHDVGIIPYKFNDDDIIIKNVKVMKCNFNPYVHIKSEKKYYQRDYVWTLEDNQNLIESIYQGIDCGRILVRKRSWKEIETLIDKGETEVAFLDIVDGKQRLHALDLFVNNKITDKYGNFWGDLSFIAQLKFLDNQYFQYSQMPELTKDEDVLYQFLKLNFTVSQSKEHINYVKTLLELHKRGD